MEHNGRLQGRVNSFPKLKQLLTRVSYRSKDTFLTLDKEGHDTYLMNQSNVDVFGVISVHVDRLIRLIDNIVPGEETAEITEWDGYCNPLKVTFTSVMDEADPITKKMHTVHQFAVQWDMNMKWMATKRFSLIFEFKKQLEAEFDHLPPFSQIQLTKAKVANALRVR